MAASKLIVSLAKQLLKTYADKEVTDLLLGEDALADGLAKMIERHLIDLEGATKVTDALVESVIAQLVEVQKNSGILKADGIFGQRTLNWFLKRPFGHHDRPKSDLPTTSRDVSPSGIHALRFFFAGDDMPNIPGKSDLETIGLLTAAWQSWSKVCDIVVRMTGSPDDANVIVNVKVLDGSGSMLAIADVGPPGNRQLELTFDKGETFTPRTFQATAAHEIGHILGLRHIGAQKQLMNDTLHDDILIPQEHDIAAAVAIWGPP